MMYTGGRQPWDMPRFVKTVLFFNEPPSPERLVRNLQKAAKQVQDFMTTGYQQVRGGTGAGYQEVGG